MKSVWLILAGIAASEQYRLRLDNKRERLGSAFLWLIVLLYAGVACIRDELPLPVWIVRGLFGWTDHSLALSGEYGGR